MVNNDQSNKSGTVNLAEVTRLVEALEHDLAKLREGSSDLDTLRAEVEQLRVALHASDSSPGEVQHGLHGIRTILRKIEDELVGDAMTASDYIARIGRMLGM